MGKGSKAPSGPQESTVTQTNLPEYARPFYEEMLGRTVYESTRPYEAFPGQRLAEFNPFEQTAMTGIAEMTAAGAPQQIRSASDIATQIGFQPSNLGLNIAQGFTPQAQFSGYQAGDITADYAAGDLGQGFQAGQRDVGYQAGQFDPGFEAGTVADAATIQSYMNPYQQLVTDIEKREAKRASDVQAAEIGQQAAMAGGLGGYREGILQAERERNLAQQLADIQTRGGQAAFDQAQKAFEADRAARLQQAQIGLTAQQQEDAARRAQEDFAQQQFQQNQQLMLAQQQEDRAAFQASEAARREAAQLGLSAQEVEERARQADNEARMRAREFNVQAAQDQAQLGLAGLQADQATRGQALDAARLLSSLGGQEQAMAFDRLQNLQAAGEIQRQLAQRGMDIGYQDFLRQQAFPREQIGFFSNILQGLPVTPGSTMASFGVGPTDAQSLLGAGIGGVGLYKALGT
jgi:hypothetical protein